MSLLPWQRKGYEVIDRYDNEDPARGDQLVLEHLRGQGSHLSKPRHIVHYLYFPDDEMRDAAEAKLRLKEYETRHGVEAPGPLVKSLIAERHGVVNDDVIEEERVMLEGIAEASQGEYDGWEAQID